MHTEVPHSLPHGVPHVFMQPILNKVFDEVSHNNKSFSKLNISDFNMELNNHLELCICKLCKNILYNSVILQKCEHSFCFKCIFPLLQGKQEDTTKCPTCSVPILLQDLQSSKTVNNMLGCLVIECRKNCGETFKIENSVSKHNHEETCEGVNKIEISANSSSTTLSDIVFLN